jgi:WD40 repeat protein
MNPRLNQRSFQGSPQTALSQGAWSIHSLAFSPDGKVLAQGGERRMQTLVGLSEAVAGDRGEVRLVDARDGKDLVNYQGHTGPVHWLAFAADGRRLSSAALVGGRGKERVEEKVWDTAKHLKGP